MKIIYALKAIFIWIIICIVTLFRWFFKMENSE
jgi:hypothetical protein